MSSSQNPALPAHGQKSLNVQNLITLTSVAILVGTELLGAAVAAGWALGGLFQLGELITQICAGVFICAAVFALYAFMREAERHEPLYGTKSTPSA